MRLILQNVHTRSRGENSKFRKRSRNGSPSTSLRTATKFKPDWGRVHDLLFDANTVWRTELEVTFF
ncbi:MAG: hypothetical protein CBD74_05070 [Saprospirales bacterium TMED214]|nr:MAG: hypothetical protein CBD74_05070 [Saprospirales bacterium TMED214]